MAVSVHTSIGLIVTDSLFLSCGASSIGTNGYGSLHLENAGGAGPYDRLNFTNAQLNTGSGSGSGFASRHNFYVILHFFDLWRKDDPLFGTTADDCWIAFDGCFLQLFW
jgi:hypothetical protein